MNEEQRQKTAFFRYQVIAPILNLSAEESLQQAFRLAAERHYDVPDIPYPKKFSERTIEQWYYAYKKNGLDALKPSSRSDRGESKTIVGEVATEIEKMLIERPRLTAPIVLKELEAKGLIKEGEVSLSAFYRFRRGKGLKKSGPAKASNYRAFEFEYPQECWQTDVLFGPSIADKDGKRRKTYLVAVIDDCTRVITHGQFYFEQNLTTFIDTLKQSMLKRGIPKRLYLDNAFVFRSQHVMRVAANLGIQLIHSRPYKPEGRAKIERFFRTVRTQFLARVDGKTTTSLEELNSLFWSWLEGEYHSTKHRTLEETPLEKWLRLSDFVRPVPHNVDLDIIFMHQAKRKVLIDGTFQLNKQKFEVLGIHVGKKITIHYDPGDLRRVYISEEGKIVDVAYPIDLVANSTIRRDKAPEPHNESSSTLVSLQHLHDKLLEDKNHACDTKQN